MSSGAGIGRQAATDREAGVYRGREVARRFVSPGGFVVLVGKAASDNDLLTFKLGRPADFWMHVAAESGSHVLILNPSGATRLPRACRDFAAGLAAGYSKAKSGGSVAVHLASVADVSKPRGAEPGKAALRRYTTVFARPLREENGA